MNPIEPRAAATIWVRTMDANGVFRFLQFGTLDFTGYREMTVSFDAQYLGIVYPLSVVGITITQASTINEQTPGVFLDDLTASRCIGQRHRPGRLRRELPLADPAYGDPRTG